MSGSNAIFPALPGEAWGCTKSPEFSTEIKKSLSGHEWRLGNYAHPIWNITLRYDLLSAEDGHFQELCGFFAQRRGAFESFFFVDPDDHYVSRQGIGIGNGINKTFQLVRQIGGSTEPVMWPTIIDGIFVNGVGKGYAQSDKGVVVLTDAPPATAVVEWSGSYYYRCRFSNDSTDFRQFASQLWDLGSLELRGSLGDKI